MTVAQLKSLSDEGGINHTHKTATLFDLEVYADRYSEMLETQELEYQQSLDPIAAPVGPGSLGSLRQHEFPQNLIYLRSGAFSWSIRGRHVPNNSLATLKVFLGNTVLDANLPYSINLYFVFRPTHNPEVAGSNPVPATKRKSPSTSGDFAWLEMLCRSNST
jgi:hypothetical protein